MAKKSSRTVEREEVASGSKNIVVMSDGTGQEGGKGHPTNVYKLFNMLENRTARQVIFYDRGLGTGWRKITGNVGGRGISKNVLECYEFIFKHYNAGDRIFFFGFSRGAATVRTLSSFIHLFGILPKSRPELIKKAYRIYKTPNEAKRKRRADDFLARHQTMWCRIRFLGVWDTVAALGVPFKGVDVLVDKVPFLRHKFHDFRLSDSVQNARHALAIDDERLTFHPLVWDEHLSRSQKERDVTVKQVWFCGMHTDVGGGYPEHELSDIPLRWMIEEALEYDLLLYPGRKPIVLNPDPSGTMHNSRGSGFSRLYRWRPRSWDSAKRGKPRVHQSVEMRVRNRSNDLNPPYAPWIFDLEYDLEPWPRDQRKRGPI